MKKKITKYCIIGMVVIFSIGVTVGKLTNWGYFVLVKEISIIDVFALLTTIILAIYITNVLEKKVHDIRIEKELHIAKISELEAILSNYEVMVEEKVSYNKIVNRFQSCRIKKNAIFSNIKNNFKQIKTEELDELNKSITENMTSLKRLLTETPVVPTTAPEISIKNNFVTYSPNRIIKISTKITIINEILFKIKIRINYL